MNPSVTANPAFDQFLNTTAVVFIALHPRTTVRVRDVGKANEKAFRQKSVHDGVARGRIEPEHAADLRTRQHQTGHLVIVVAYQAQQLTNGFVRTSIAGGRRFGGRSSTRS